MGLRRDPPIVDRRYGVLSPADKTRYGGTMTGEEPGLYPGPVTRRIPAVDPSPSGVQDLKWIKVNNPLPGVDFEYRHDFDRPAMLLHAYYRFDTSVVVGNRICQLSLTDDSGARVAGHYANVAQGGTIAREWQFSHNWPLGSGVHAWYAALGFILCWLPLVYMLPGYTFQSAYHLQFLDADDQFTQIRLLLSFPKL